MPYARTERTAGASRTTSLRSCSRTTLDSATSARSTSPRTSSLYLDLADERGIVSPLAGIAASCYRGTVAAGFAQHYHPIVIRWLEQIAGARAQPSSSTRPASEVVESIARGVAATQTVATLEALTLLARIGLDPGPASEHLRSGSAGNASLDAVARHMEGRRTS